LGRSLLVLDLDLSPLPASAAMASESAAQAPAVVEALAPHYGLDAPAGVAYRVSWPDQVLLRCRLGTLADEMAAARIHLTALILVGPMLEPERAADSRLYDREYTHRFRRGQ